MRRILAALFLLALAIPALPVAATQPLPCVPTGLVATYPVPCVTPTPQITPTPTPETQPSPTPTPGSQCDVRDPRPGVCSEPVPTPTPSPVPSPTATPAASPSPTPDATPETPAVPPLPPTDTLAADPLQEAPPAYLWLLGIVGLAVAFWPRPVRRRSARWQDWPYQARRFMAREVRR